MSAGVGVVSPVGASASACCPVDRLWDPDVEVTPHSCAILAGFLGCHTESESGYLNVDPLDTIDDSLGTRL